MPKSFYPNYWFVAALRALATFLLCLNARAAEPVIHDGTNALTVMTFNLRFASDTPPNAWAQRRPVMRACIEQVSPDVFGTQEGVYSQLKDMAADLPGYAWIGLGRDGGSRGEFMTIFYQTKRLDPLEFDHFWLSDTPNLIASTNWGNTNRRMVTWVKFQDLKTHKPFYFFNTHLDHQVQVAREKGAALIRQRIEELKTDLPVILGGDFNADAGANKAYSILTEDGFLTDTWPTALTRRNETYNSFHNYQPVQNSQRIDWILGRGITQTFWSEVVLFKKDGQYPSDHFPVGARILLKTNPN